MTAHSLRPGDTIGLISPSHVADPEHYGHLIAALERKGFRIKTAPNLYRNTYGFSASEYERADDLNAMFADDEVGMVFFGGGEGANELLPYIDFENIRRHPKLVCSYSDGTTILDAIYAKTGLVTYYGQSPGEFDDLRDYNYAQFRSHFVDADAGRFIGNSPWVNLRGGVGEGLLLGGYTLNFARLLGSDYLPYDKTQKYVLFLEDHEKFSCLAALSACLSHIGQSGFMEHVTGMLFGHYSTTDYPELLRMLARFGEKYGIPVAHNDDFGHGVNHAILPIGRRARLDADAGTLDFL